MNRRDDIVARALAVPGRREILEALGTARPDLGPPQAQQLSARLESFEEPRTPVRVAWVRTYTTELLRPYLRLESLLRGLAVESCECPYGSLLEEVRPGSALRAFEPDIVYFMLQWEDLEPRLAGPVTGPGGEETAAAAVERLAGWMHGFRAALGALLVVTLLPRMTPPELGLCDPMAADSEAAFFAGLKARISARFRDELPDTLFLDLDDLVREHGRRRFFDNRLWLAGRAPFSAAGAQAVAARLTVCAFLRKTPPVKCIVLDADNTLWGGVAGEDGLEGIALGPDYPGAAFVAFQRRLLHFQRRGILLAVCSKNNPADLLEILRDHPHQVLRESHFAAIQAGWAPKPEQVRALAARLGLGIDSFLFVDDSPQECLALRQAFPELDVVQTPARPSDIPGCLDELPRLETLRRTAEDQQRTGLYAAEQARRQAAAGRAPEEYLASLRMVMTFGVNDPAHAARVAQLTQKTNQFNLTTRRYSEAEIRRFMEAPGGVVAHFSLADIFGDSGVAGAAIVRAAQDGTAEIDTFLMSCRVIGRQAERAFLRALLDRLAARGVARVRAAYAPTPKNGLVRDFWPRQGFAESAPGIFELEIARRPGEDAPPIVLRNQPAN